MTSAQKDQKLKELRQEIRNLQHESESYKQRFHYMSLKLEGSYSVRQYIDYLQSELFSSERAFNLLNDSVHDLIAQNQELRDKLNTIHVYTPGVVD